MKYTFPDPRPGRRRIHESAESHGRGLVARLVKIPGVPGVQWLGGCNTPPEVKVRQRRASHCTQLDLAEQLQRTWQLNSTGDGPIVNGFQQQEMPALRTCPTRDLLLIARLTVLQPPSLSCILHRLAYSAKAMRRQWDGIVGCSLSPVPHSRESLPQVSGEVAAPGKMTPSGSGRGQDLPAASQSGQPFRAPGQAGCDPIPAVLTALLCIGDFVGHRR